MQSGALTGPKLYSMNPFSYHRAADTADALGQIERSPAHQFIGGGTNLLDLWKYNLTHPSTLVDITRLDDLKQITELPNGGLRLGALATNADTAYHPIVQKRYPLLSRAILAAASAQIRNSATNGGNLLQRTRCLYFYDQHSPCNKREPGTGCPAIAGHHRKLAILGHSTACIATHPSDMCVALAALEAVVQVAGPEGERSIPIADFHRLPGEHPEIDTVLGDNELITAIDLPAEGYAAHHSYLKVRDRNSYAFALVSVATGFTLLENRISNARIALGGVAHKPWRVREAEIYLSGKAPIDEHFSVAADMVLEGAEGFGQNNFKIPLAKRAIIRNGRMALDPDSQRPGARPSL